MKRMNRLWETMLSAVAMAAAVAIAAVCFVKATELSRSAYAQDTGLGRVQAAADMLSATSGDLGALGEFFGGEEENGVLAVRFDGDMRALPWDREGGTYILYCGPVSRGDDIGTCPVILEHVPDGAPVFGVTASWLEFSESEGD